MTLNIKSLKEINIMGFAPQDWKIMVYLALFFTLGLAITMGTGLAIDCPYAWYHLNETSGTNVYDSSANNRNGITVNNPSWVNGLLNNSLKLDGVDQYVNFTDNSIGDFEKSDQFSMETWFKTNSTSAMIVFNKRTIDEGNGYQILLANGGEVWVVIGNGSSSNSFIIVYSDFINYTDLEWHHFVITYDGSSSASGVYIYLDSVRSQNIVFDGLSANISNIDNLVFGTENGYGYFDGRLDEIVFYAKELNQSEVDARYNNGTGTEYIVGCLSPILSNNTPPFVGINSPLNQTYNTGFVPINFTIYDDNSNFIWIKIFFDDEEVFNDSSWINGSEFYSNEPQWQIGTHNLTLWANDSELTNSTDIIYTIIDNTPPMMYYYSYSAHLCYNQTAFFLTSWYDETGLAGYVFSHDDCFPSGYINDSYVSNSTPYWLNGNTTGIAYVTKLINSSVNCTYKFLFYARDVVGNWNVTNDIGFNVENCSCTCGSWTNGSCFNSTHRLQTRSCVPSLCGIQTQYANDSSCIPIILPLYNGSADVSKYLTGYCLDNNTIKMNGTYQGQLVEITYLCHYGCDMDTNQCFRATSTNWFIAIGMIFGAIILMSVIYALVKML
jgi:hypothetical protein